MKRTAALVIFLVASSGPWRAATPILPFDQVATGMRGTGRTVFQGTKVETFDVEILGRLPRIGPDQSLILGRCSGGPLAQTGVLAGMSGSPVYVDGKLIGAVAYAWGFAKDAIAGITPIEEMLAVGAGGQRSDPRPSRSAGTAGAELARLGSPARMSDFVAIELPARLGRASPAAGNAVPISVSGLGSAGLARISPDLALAGLLAVQAGGAGSSPDPSPPPEPGAAIGLKLVRGDVDMTATGTLTALDGDRVVGFGHPLFGLGSVALPLTGARVEALLPSLDRSLRLATPLAEIGAIVEDRQSAVAGRLGSSPRMIPVRLRLLLASGAEKTYAFDLADDPLLSPLLLYASLNGVLAGAERVVGGLALRLREGSVIKMDGQEDVVLDNLFSGSTAPYYATATPAFLLYLLMNNDRTPPRVSGVNLILEYRDEPRVARVRRVTLDRYRVRAGADVEATIVLSPYRGADLVVRHRIRIPEETPPGPLLLDVGDGSVTTRNEAGDSPPLPRALAQLVALINRVPRNDYVYLVASREDAGIAIGGERLPNLPPSVATILARPRSRGNFASVPRRSIVEERIPLDHAVEGLARVELEVLAP